MKLPTQLPSPKQSAQRLPLWDEKEVGMAGDSSREFTIQSLLDSGVIISHKDGNYGSNYPRVEEFGNAGVPFLTAKSLSNGYVDIAGAPRLNDERAESLRFGFVEAGDVLLSHNATIGRVAVVPEYPGRLLIGTSLTYFRLDPQHILPRFFAVCLSGKAFQDELAAVMSHSTRNQVPITAQRTLRVVIPPLPEQRAIAHILGTLDDKIELNRRMNETLEAMARALFQSWFVDFDPVRAKAERRDSGLPKPIADLFPDSFQDSELGEIPKGWKVRPFANTIEIIGGGTPKTSIAEYWNGDIPWFSVVDAPSGSDVWVVDTEKKITCEGIENSSTRLLPVGTTIISARGTVGRIALVGVPMAMNQFCYGLCGEDGTHGYFAYFTTRELVASLQQHAHGSVFDTITRDTLAGVSVALPSPTIIETFESRIGSSLERIRVALLESRTLAALRDALLPKLISGELRVKDAERVAGRHT